MHSTRLDARQCYLRLTDRLLCHYPYLSTTYKALAHPAGCAPKGCRIHCPPAGKKTWSGITCCRTGGCAGGGAPRGGGGAAAPRRARPGGRRSQSRQPSQNLIIVTLLGMLCVLHGPHGRCRPATTIEDPSSHGLLTHSHWLTLSVIPLHFCASETPNPRQRSLSPNSRRPGSCWKRRGPRRTRYSATRPLSQTRWRRERPRWPLRRPRWRSSARRHLRRSMQCSSARCAEPVLF